jgi:hypothetical protein
MRPVQAFAAESDVGGWAQLIRDEDLLGQTHQEPGHTERDIFGFEREASHQRDRLKRFNQGGGVTVDPGRLVRTDAAELGHHLLVMENGASDQVRKECNEEQVREKVLDLCLPLGEIYQIGDLGEGKKGDAQREQDRMRVDVSQMERLDGHKALVEVLEVEEGKQVEGDTEGQ